MTNAERLAEARAALAAITKRIESFDGGDRPPSPPASLLMEEARLRALVDYYELAEKDRIERERKQAKLATPAPAPKPATAEPAPIPTTPPTTLPS